MSILTVVQDAALELGLGAVSAVIGSTDVQVRQMLAFAHREGHELRDRFVWPQLVKEHSFTIATGQASYNLPADLDRVLFETHWVQGRSWPLIGPLSPQEWQFRKNGIVNAGPRQRYRVKGMQTNEFFLDPTPGAGENGNVVVFEYVPTTWIMPVAWATSTVFSFGSFCSNDGNIYLAATSGTTGATAPTHTSGNVSDGGVTWTFRSDAYNKFLADSDNSLISEHVLTLAVMWRYLRSKRLEYADIFAEYDVAVKRASSKLRGAQTLNLNGARFLGMPTPSVPETGYGGV